MKKGSEYHSLAPLIRSLKVAIATNLPQILSQIVKRFDVPQLAILYSLDCPSQNIFDGPDVEGVDDREEGEEPFEDVEDVGDAEDK